MARKFFRFGPWVPDAQSDNDIVNIKNVKPSEGFYKPFPSFTALTTNSITTTCIGSFTAFNDDGNTVVFAGEVGKLSKLNVDSFLWAQVGSGYSTSSSVRWSFAQYNKLVMATNFTDGILFSTVSDTLTKSFTTLLSISLKARHITTARNFLIAGNISDTDGLTTNRVRWSAIGDPSDFEYDIDRQADSQDLAGTGGPITGLVSGLLGADVAVFQRNALWRMQYQGGEAIWSFDLVEQGRGTTIPGGIVNIGSRVFYISESGFYSFDGVEAFPIGANRVDEYFFENFRSDKPHLLSSSFDPHQKVVYWSFPGINDGEPNKILAYNYAVDEWSLIESSIQSMAQVVLPSYTLELLDIVADDITELEYSLDSNYWNRRVLALGCVLSTGQFGLSVGQPLDATLETVVFKLQRDEHLSFVSEVWPLVDGGSDTDIVSELSHKKVAWHSLSGTVTRTANAVGFCQFRDTSRYHKVRVTISSNNKWKAATGVEITHTRMGRL